MQAPLNAASPVLSAALLFLLLSACGDGGGATAGTGGAAGGGGSTMAGGGSTASGTGGAAGSGGSTMTGGGSTVTGSGGDGGSMTGTGGSTMTGAGGSGGSAPIAIKNPGFEADAVAAGKYNDKIIPAGWVKYDPGNIIGQDYNSIGVLNPTGTVLYPAGAPQGSNVALIFLWRMQTDGVAAGLFQQLPDVLLADTQYTLRVKVGNIAPETGVAWDLTGFPGYRVELLAGGAVLAADDNTLSPPDGSFAQSTVTFTAPGSHPSLGQPLGVRLLNLNKGNSGIEVNFDDVQLEAGP